MDPANYYITTLTNAFKNIAPIAIFLVGGYLVFIKMPFLFLKKSMDEQKKKLQEENKDLSVTVNKERQTASPPKLKVLEGSEQKKVDPRARDQQQKKAEERREAPKRPVPNPEQSPEVVFNFRPGEVFSKSELKKRYFELLKQNHPDRVASMGQDFKKLAEKNTKEINKAYDKLKNRAS